MGNLDKQMKLAEEAVELIKEFREVASILGVNPLKGISIKENGAVIEVEDEFDGIVEYELEDISSIFSTEMRGWGPCSAGFYEAMDLSQSELEYDFKMKKYTKDEFIKYAGGLKYAEYRCEEIYKRLDEIEEAANI